jgi:hypothetical protein
MTDKNLIVNLFQKKLSSLGFIITNQQESESFGNFLIDMSKENLKVRLVSDRSQLFLRIQGINDDGWMPLSTIKCYLDNSETLTGMEINEELNYFISNVDWFLNEYDNSSKAVNDYATIKWKEHWDKISPLSS